MVTRRACVGSCHCFGCGWDVGQWHVPRAGTRISPGCSAVGKSGSLFTNVSDVFYVPRHPWEMVVWKKSVVNFSLLSEENLSGRALLPVESPKGVSPLGSHGTVLESLPSHGSSCLITNVFLHHGYTNLHWLWSRSRVADLPNFWLSAIHETKQAKSFAPLSFNNFITTTP